jgi:hypothetical protein
MGKANVIRDQKYARQHDSVYASLDLISNWMVFGHLTLKNELQWTEHERLKKFHLLIRDTAKRFTGTRDLNELGWFLKEEGDLVDRRYHFHFAMTSDNLTTTTVDVVCRYLTKQWGKIGKSLCQIDPWEKSKTPLGIWYLTQNDLTPGPHSRYFHGEYCRWKMSTLLLSRILEQSNKQNV